VENKYFYKSGFKTGLILALTFLTACHSGWDKDPYASESDKIKKAITPDTKFEKIPPPDRNTLYSHILPVYSVQEGEELVIISDFEIAHPEVKLTDIRIKDLNKIFPNSSLSFTDKTLTIKIKPGFDVVASDLNYLTQDLQVEFESIYEDQLFSVTYKTAILILPVNTEAPEIKKIDTSSFPAPIVVGNNYKFKIEVIDTSAEYSPRIQVLDRLGISQATGSQFVKFSQTGIQSPKDPNLWIFDAELNLPTDLQVGLYGKYFSLDFIAYSVSGIPSRADQLNFTAYTVATSPTFLTIKNFDLNVDDDFYYILAVADDLNRGTISARCSKLPANFKCNCVNSAAIGEPSQCRLSWTPKVPGEYIIEIKAINTVKQGYLSKVSQFEGTQELKIKVRP
jgi:hypothetical protein